MVITQKLRLLCCCCCCCSIFFTIRLPIGNCNALCLDILFVQCVSHGVHFIVDILHNKDSYEISHWHIGQIVQDTRAFLQNTINGQSEAFMLSLSEWNCCWYLCIFLTVNRFIGWIHFYFTFIFFFFFFLFHFIFLAITRTHLLSNEWKNGEYRREKKQANNTCRCDACRYSIHHYYDKPRNICTYLNLSLST